MQEEVLSKKMYGEVFRVYVLRCNVLLLLNGKGEKHVCVCGFK